MTIESPPERGRIAVINPLRGLAALSVVWLHLVHEMGYVQGSDPGYAVLYETSTIGRSGAQVFFVISGFVIPYALAASGYRVRFGEYGRFILKRLIRLDPPYIAAIGLILLVAAYHTLIDGDRFPYSVPQVLVHIGYLNVFFRYHWLATVFWTLGVEVQYYLLIGLVFPILLRPLVFWVVIAPATILFANHHLKPYGYIFPWVPFFLLGIAAFHYRRGMINLWVFSGVILLPTLYALVWTGPVTAAACFATAIVIATVSGRMPKPLVWLGTISYSLYLTHWIVGVTVGHGILSVSPRVEPIAIVLVSLAACLAAAWGFYRLVELPSLRWSKRVRYGVTPRDAKKRRSIPRPSVA
jgi:peptidoglycan/LPS O-acetylase OafA/YrhL